MSTDYVSVALVNGSEIISRGLVAMLSRFGARVQISTTKPERIPVDATLIDTAYRSVEDIAVVEDLVYDVTAGAVVLFVWEIHPSMVQKAIQQGCRGCLSKSSTGEELVAALERAAFGEIVVSPCLQKGSGHSMGGASGLWLGHREGLSQREAEIIGMIAEGMTNAEIAEAMYVTINTVKSYIRGAYGKLGIRRRAEAVRWGIEHGHLIRG